MASLMLPRCHPHLRVGMEVGRTDAAIEAADATLVKSDLARLAEALLCGRKAKQLSTQNIVLSIAVLIVMIPLAVAGRSVWRWS